MKPAIAALLAFSLFGSGESVNFDNLKLGVMAPYWTAVSNRPNPTATKWEVLRDATAPSRFNVLVKTTSIAGESEFPMAIFDKVICRDGDLTVKFRIKPSNTRYKTVGLVWRYQNPQNYYLLHFSVDEKNIMLLRMQDGQPKPIPVSGAKNGAPGVPHDLKTDQWYVAKVIFRGDRIRVLFGNRQLFDATDDSLTNAGKTGVWTRDGTLAAFDDFRIDRKG